MIALSRGFTLPGVLDFCLWCDILFLIKFLIYLYYIAYLRECQYKYENFSRIFERSFLCSVNFYENYALKKELHK